MSFREAIFLILSLSVVGLLAGCGSSFQKATPPPSGGFSNSNLNGTYVFSVTGSDANANFLTMLGTFTACGCSSGTISAGAVDLNDPAFSAPVLRLPITGGSYTVGVDGRGQAKLSAATPFGTSIILDFVLTSGSHGLVTEFDANGTGSGTIDLQGTVSQVPAGAYVFNLAGISGINAVTGSGIPLATVGAIALDASGNGTGIQDYNNNEAYTALTIGSGSNVLLGTGPGTATLVTNGPTFHFDVYAIDSTHLKVIETDSAPILSGDLFSQPDASLPSGQLVFTMAGNDFSVSPSVPLVIGGLMHSDGAAVISAGAEDVNDAGSTTGTPVSFSGSIASSGGRFVLQLNNFENGAGGLQGTYTFAAYPSSNGVQLLEIDSGGITGGAAFAQSSTSLTSAQGYGLNLSAVNTVEEDDIAEFTNNSGSFSGLVDVNDQGSPTPDQKFSGTYTADANNPGRATISTNAFNLTSYVVDSSTVIFIETDPNQLGIGSFQLQNSSGTAQAALSHFALTRPRPAGRLTHESQ